MILMDGVHPEMDTCIIVEYKGKHLIGYGKDNILKGLYLIWSQADYLYSHVNTWLPIQYAIRLAPSLEIKMFFVFFLNQCFDIWILNSSSNIFIQKDIRIFGLWNR